MSKTTWLSVGSWIAIVTTLWIVALIIAESIPTFNDLLSLISSLFVSWFTYGIAGEQNPSSLPRWLADRDRNLLALHQSRQRVPDLEEDIVDDRQRPTDRAWSSDLRCRIVRQW